MYYEVKNEMLDRLVLQKKSCANRVGNLKIDTVIQPIKEVVDILSEYGSEVEQELKEMQKLEQSYEEQMKRNGLATIDSSIVIRIENEIEAVIEWVKKNVTPTYDKLTYVTMVKNEAQYIKEWIEYHKLVGVTKFYIYDHYSEDNLLEVLQEYIDSGEVIYQKWDKNKFHTACFQDAFQRYKFGSKYIGFIDCDEFVVPVQKCTIVEVVDEIMAQDSHCAGVGPNWVMYGTSGHEVKPEGLVTENYTMHMPPSFCHEIKTIANPRLITSFTHMHYANYKEGYYAVNEKGEKLNDFANYNYSVEKIRINHYYTKSTEEFMKKSKRGRGDNGLPIDMRYYYMNNRNEVYDDIMIPYVKRLKEILNKKQ